MNITSLLIYCFIVTFTLGPTNIVILSTMHNFGAKRAMKYIYGSTIAFGLLLFISAVLNSLLLGVIPKILNVMQIVGTFYMLCEKDEALCSELLLSLTDSLIETDLSTDLRKDNPLIRKAKEMLHANIENVLKLDKICKELNLSKFQFIRLFKAQTGISPYQYFLNCKIESAKQLIETNRDIYSAVAECGFVDITHLNKHFKSVYGTTAFKYMSYLNGFNAKGE